MAASVVQVEPPFVDFNDIRVGQVYKTTVIATNVGKISRKIIIEKPASKLFKFTLTSAAAVVAPGLCVSGVLHFTPREEEMVRDRLLIHVDGMEAVEVPLRGFPRTCSLLMDSLLDFGCVAANRQIISKHHPITNQGTAPGVFHIQYNGEPSVKVTPRSGVVAGGATRWLQLDLRTDKPMQIEEKALVRLQNRSPVVLTIRAEVADQQLGVFDLKGNPVSCLRFGPLYFGTSSVESVVLTNNSPQVCDWVCLLQDSAAGTEVGRDLQKSTDAVLLNTNENCSATFRVLFCLPKQGHLKPYGKTTVTVRFSPVSDSTPKKTRRHKPASRQDFCLFLLFESAGSRHGFTHRSGNCSVELAVTGSGLPVSLVPSPSQKFDFPACVIGQSADKLCVLQNLCTQIPIHFQFRKLAQFSAKPFKGTIAPGQCQDVVLSFTAHQLGSFQMCQILDVLGQVHQSTDSTDGPHLELCSFHTVTLHLSAVCPSENIHSRLKPISGLSEEDHCHVRTCDVAAALVAKRTKKVEDDKEIKNITAFVSQFCNMDISFDLTSAEQQLKYQNHQFYDNFIKELRQTRISRNRERQYEKEMEMGIGLVSAQGLVPPKLSVSDIDVGDITEVKLNYKPILPKDMTDKTQVSEVFSAVPTTSQEVADCRKTLTAQQLCQVVIGPSSVDFGEVCVDSVSVQKLQLINHLSMYIWVQLEVDCPELQGSSPLSHVLPPCSHTSLPLTFQSTKQGPYYRPMSYSVNQQHLGQILVQAHVVSVALELSTTLLVLRPSRGFLAHSGYHCSVTVRNRRNHPAEFTWRPIVTEKGITFSIRPATGTVEPFRELDCDVVWEPSFSSPAEGDFEFIVHEGNIQHLHCVAKVGSTGVQLSEKQLVFCSVPLNMASIRTAILHNTGQNHAYYQVEDVCPLPGMVVSPWEGVVPCGGKAELKILFSPNTVIKFDTRVKIALRNMKSMELRVNGSVEPPNVEISLSHFQFSVVHAGSRRLIPFSLTNHSCAAARVTFDLSHYLDFTLRLPLPPAKKEPGVSIIEVQSNKTIDCTLIFSPRQVAGYDFFLPLICNGEKWQSGSASVETPVSIPSVSSSLSPYTWKHVVSQPSHSVAMATARSVRIQATVVCAPLEVSCLSLQFHLDPLSPQSGVYTKAVELKTVCEQSICWRDFHNQRLNWWFKCSSTVAPAEGRRLDELLTVTPTCGILGPSQSMCVCVSIKPEAVNTESGRLIRLSLPLYVGDKAGKGIEWEDTLQPYRELDITVTIQPLNITFHPPQILLSPVPLESSTTATLTLLAEGYPCGMRVSAEVEEVVLQDGRKIQPVSVLFPEGNFITLPNQEERHPMSVQSSLEAGVTYMTCTVSFCSAVPLSLCTTVTFTEQRFHKRFKVQLFATADNCVLTVWPYMAQNRSEQQIVLKTGSTANEVVLQRCHTPTPASRPASSFSSFDHESGTNKTITSDSMSERESESGQSSRDEEVSTNGGTLLNIGIPEFPAANSEEGVYHQMVLLAVERWFTLFGWPDGPNPVSVPHTFRRVVLQSQAQHSIGRTYRVTQNKDSRSVLDMLRHLIGAKIPGIPHCETLSPDIEQRTNQLLQRHEAVLAFLRKQGACLKHIKPEYLLDAQEFKQWRYLQSNKDGNGLDYRCVDYESLSKRSWTDVLLQIYKVLVLSRVSKQSSVPNQEELNGILPIGSQPRASNVYSNHELTLLSWLNKHYHNMRKTVCGEGGVPSARWIVNFDRDFTDGLVLAALLAAYCPYLVCSHSRRMYTSPNTVEQILHNNIIVAQALNSLCLNIDIQPTDLSDPNPVQILMLCVHLYERLPQYLPLQTITLTGKLRNTFSKKVRVKSPFTQPVKYQAFLLGENTHLFSLPDGNIITILPKTGTEFTIRYRCLFMKPMEAILLLISIPAFTAHTNTLAFSLRTSVSRIIPTHTVKCASPCYELRVVQLPIMNLFTKEAKFRVVLVESPYNPLEPEKKNPSQRVSSSRTNIEKTNTDMEGKLSAQNREFLSAVTSVCLKSGESEIVNIHFLPFSTGSKFCSVLLVCPQVGDMVYLLKATAHLPRPSPLSFEPSSNIISRPNTCVVSLQCQVEQVCEEVLHLPLVNLSWERALAIWGQQGMSSEEHRRRLLTRTLYSSSVRASTAGRLFKRQVETVKDGIDSHQVITYSVQASLPQYFTLPSTVEMPVIDNTHVPWENPADCDCVEIPIHFLAPHPGVFTSQVVLNSSSDIRVFILEALVTPQMEPIPLTNPTAEALKLLVSWRLCLCAHSVQQKPVSMVLHLCPFEYNTKAE